jgi:hypothetical protein
LHLFARYETEFPGEIDVSGLERGYMASVKIRRAASRSGVARKALFLVAVCACGLWNCDTIYDDSPYLSMRELDQSAQPTSGDLGILVSVSARGGDVVRIDVAGGTLDFFDAAGVSSVCVESRTTHEGLLQHRLVRLPNRDGGAAVSFVVAVHPRGQSEALLNATLGRIAETDRNDAGGPAAAGTGNGAGEAGAAGTGAGAAGAAASGSSVPSAGLLDPSSFGCGAIEFDSLGYYSSLTVSLGRAPIPESSGGASGTTAQAGGGVGGGSQGGGGVGGGSQGGGGVGGGSQGGGGVGGGSQGGGGVGGGSQGGGGVSGGSQGGGGSGGMLPVSAGGKAGDTGIAGLPTGGAGQVGVGG